MKNLINKIVEKIEGAKNIIITGHVNPDGDAIGSGLSLLLGLKKKYPTKNIDFVLQDKIPKNIKFLSGVEEIKNVDDVLEKEYDLAIFVDSANIDRTGEKIQNLTKNIFKINIDHHISNTKYGDINIIENISSTSELMYTLLNLLNIEIDFQMGQAIYIGIINDTGNFSHDNVTKDTFMVAAKIIELGVNNNYLVTNFFKSRSLEKMRVFGKALSEMTFIEDKKLSIFFLSYNDMENLNIDKDDTDGIVEEILRYNDCEVSLFLREDTPGKIKGSMRSKNDIDVNKIASIFNGGGHIKAAGFNSNLPSKKIIEKVIEIL